MRTWRKPINRDLNLREIKKYQEPFLLLNFSQSYVSDVYRLILNMLFQLPISEIDNEEGQEEAASYPISAEAATPDLESLAAKTEDERAEDTGLNNFFRLY